VALASGTRLGPYEVIAQIGAGGMGEVYRAHDTKLNRDVALKILPDAFTLDGDRIARFRREAQVLASLNHPNIAAIYGFEDSGSTHALVLELVEGLTLADRIAKGAIPLDEALPIAKQIAQALEAAHEQGIIHRDLKPANIKLRADGTIKVLDFGLAKAMEPTSAISPMLTASPTITTPAQMTGVGTLLGTAAYMAPEQAKGRPADKRSDVWAFGCVLFEMLTGKRAFEGEDVSDTLAAVLRAEPDWRALPRSLPTSIARVLHLCLEKDSRRRLRDIGDVQILSDENSPAPINPLSTTSVASLGRRALPAAIGVTLVLVGVAIGLYSRMRPVPGRVERFELVTPQSAPFTANPPGPNVVMSPDGSQIVYHVQRENHWQLALRKLDRLDQIIIPGTEEALFPIFSPDGSEVAFVSTARRKLLKAALSGGPVTELCDLTSDVAGASWGANDVIVFAELRNGLFRVPGGGGKPELIATPDNRKGELSYSYPEVLPGGNAVLFTIMPLGGTSNQARLAARTLANGAANKILADGATAGHYIRTGHLVYSQAGTLMAVPFDVEKLSIKGSPVAVEEGISGKGSVAEAGLANFSVGADGSLIFAPARIDGLQNLIWFDRSGKRVGSVTAQPLQYPRYPRLSPDGHRLAITIGPSNEGEIWIYDLTGASEALKLTFKGHNVLPTWTPNGKHITFSSTLMGPRNIFQLPADASSLEPERITTSPNIQAPLSWSPNGEELLFLEAAPRTGRDLWLLSLTGNRKPRQWLQTDFAEDEGTFSPNGRWIAFVSDQTGQPEVWVRPFAGPGSPIRVSPSGGHDPVWSPNGNELFYQSTGKLMSVEITATDDEIRVKSQRELFQGGFVPYQAGTPRTYDVARDGRFLMIEPNETTSPASLVLVRNWFEELKQRVPVK
jgi:serine/threonine-protein kinase